MSECKVTIGGEELTPTDIRMRMKNDPEFRKTFDGVLSQLGMISSDDSLLSDISYISLYQDVKTKQHAQLKDLRKETYTLESRLKTQSLSKNVPIDNAKLEKIKRVRQNVTEQLDTIEADIADLSRMKHSSHLKEHFTRDLDRATSLIDTIEKNISEGSLSVEDFRYKDEAIGLLKLFGKSATFDSTPNSLYNDEDIKLILDKALDDPTNAVIQAFEEVARKAAPLLDRLNNIEKDLLVNTVNSDKFIQKSFEKANDGDIIKYDYNGLLFTERGLADINFMEALTMDITNGVTSNNGLVTQVMHNKAEAVIERHKAQANKFISEMDSLTQKASDILISKGHVTSAKGILGKVTEFPDWSIFFRKTQFGKSTSELVDKFTMEFQRFLDDNFDNYNRSIREINGSNDRPSAKNAAKISERVTADNKLKEKVDLLDINSIPELRQEFGDLFTEPGDNNKVAEYKKIIGEKHYNKIVNEQAVRLRQFISDRDTYYENVDSDPVLDDTQKETRKKNWDLRYNPTYNNKKFYSFAETRSEFITDSGFAFAREVRYDTYIPKTTEFIDDRFAEIESDDTLYKFHETIKKELDENYSNLSSDLQKQYGNNYMALVEKTVKEILLDPDMTLLAKLSAAFEKIRTDLAKNFSFKAADSLAYSKRDSITGERNYRISENFIRMNDDTLKARMEINKAKLKLAFGDAYDIDSGALIIRNIDVMLPNQLDVLASVFDVSGDKLTELKKRFDVVNLPNGNKKYSVNANRIIKDNAIHETAVNMSMDLPKTMRVFSRASRMYAARNEMLPELKILKKHYEQMQKPRFNNASEAVDETDELLEKERRLDPKSPVAKSTPGLDGLRENAIAQMDSWFDRVVLGNVGTQHSPIIKKLRPILAKHLDKSTAENLMNKGGKGLANLNFSKEHIELSEVIKDLNDSLANRAADQYIEGVIDNNQYDELINKLNESKEVYERHFSLTSIVEGFLSSFRLLSLGWNIGSAFTNHIEGQLSNELLADTGDFFSQESFHKAKFYVNRNRYKTLSFGKYKDEHSEKVSFIMRNYDILQDSANELQKASYESSTDKLSNMVSPFAMTTRVEFGNQAPLAVAMLLERNISGKDGSTSSVYDALEFDPETGSVSLSDNFDTTENRNNWIDGNGEDFENYKIKVGKAIDTAHGNYSETRGMMIKDTTAGKSMMTFKTWVTRMIYDRFAAEQLDIQMNAEIPYKGRYRSVTKTVGAIGGAIIAIPAFGFPGIALGGLLGYMGGKYNQRKIEGVNRLAVDLSFAEELKLTTKALGRKLIANQANFVSKFFSDKQAMAKFDEEELSTLLSDNFNERDLANFKKNISEMAYVTQQMMIIVVAKSMLAGMFEECDSDDVECKKKNENRKQITNLVTNKSMQFIESSTMFLNPLSMWNNTMGDVPIAKLMTEFGEVTSAVQKALVGDDTITTGINAGESRLANKATKLFLPGSAPSTFDALNMDSGTNSILALAFGASSMERQFKETSFDRLGKTELQLLKKQVQGQRAAYRAELEGMGYKKKTIDKMVNDRYPTPKST